MTRTLRNAYFGFVLFCVFATKPGLLIPDGLGYVAYLPSLFLDGDLNFWNEFLFGGFIQVTALHGPALSSTGYVSNPWAVGASILWSPFWLIAHFLTILLKPFGLPWAVNGFSIYYNLAVRFATALFGFCTLIAGGIWASSYTDKKVPWLSMFLIAAGTPFFWYAFINADMSHVPAAFLITLFLIVWDIRRKSGPDRFLSFLIGILGGWITIVRPHDVFIMLFPVLFWFSDRKSKKGESSLIEWLLMTAGFLLPLLLQCWIWAIIYGSPFGPASGKGVTNYYYFFTGRIRIYEILFSSYHGLFFFSPVLFCAIYGLGKLIKQDRLLGIVSLLILLLQVSIMSMERWFWEGLSFGLRRLVDWSPLYLLGLSFLLKTTRGWFVRMGAIIFASWTILLACVFVSKPSYLLNEYQPPSEIVGWIAEFFRNLPEQILKKWMIEIPISGFLCFVVLSFVGFFVFRSILKIASMVDSTPLENRPAKRTALRTFTALLILPLILTYVLVLRASKNGEASLKRYSRQLTWLGNRSSAVNAFAVSYFILNEGKYIALTDGWDRARGSFQESLKLSPHPEDTKAEILKVAEKYLGKEQAMKYVSSLSVEHPGSE
jgi:hypothetical protein